QRILFKISGKLQQRVPCKVQVDVVSELQRTGCPYAFRNKHHASPPCAALVNSLLYRSRLKNVQVRTSTEICDEACICAKLRQRHRRLRQWLRCYCQPVHEKSCYAHYLFFHW